jgi:hypothetical protein
MEPDAGAESAASAYEMARALGHGTEDLIEQRTGS